MQTRLRSRILVSFAGVLLAIGIVTTLVVGGSLEEAIDDAVDRHVLAFTKGVATQLAEPLAYANHLEVRRILLGAKQAHPDAVYLFLAGEGRVTDHTFPHGRFPEDLLRLVERTTPTVLSTELGTVRDVPVRILGGRLGTLHVGVAKQWLEGAMARARNEGLLVGGIGGLVGIGLLLLLAGLITRPLQRLTCAARRLGKGEAVVLEHVSGDEDVAILTATFEEMAQQIQRRIAEAEATRAYFERVLDHVTVGVRVLSAELDVLYANRTVRGPGCHASTASCGDAGAGGRPCQRCPAATVLRNGGPVSVPAATPDGREYELTYVPFQDRNGRPCVLETSVEVTEVHRLGSQLRRAERLAVAGEIAAGVVHNINNPLDGVRRALDLVSRNPGDAERTRRLVELATEGTERIMGVTRTLLDLARASDEGSRIPIRIDEVIRQAVELVQLRAHGHGVEIRVAPPAAAPPLHADPNGISEVLVNLLLNAVDATSAGGLVAIETRWAPAGPLAITVTDSGTGIDPGIVDRIFEPFFTTKEVGRGTGLGLSVARRIVEAHGGQLRVRSEPGQGASFTIELPAGEPAARARNGEGAPGAARPAARTAARS